MVSSARCPAAVSFARSPRRHLLALGLGLALTTGCASPTDNGTEASAQGEQRSNGRCAATHRKLDEAARRAPRDATYDAVLSFFSAECGRSFHTAGPTQLGPERLVRIGSITKSYVSVLTLQAVAGGRIALDERIDAYLSDLPTSVTSVTVRQLLQHTSGIFNYTNTPEYRTAMREAPLQKWQPSDIVALGASKPAYFAPGAGWEYSNTNYVLLGMLLESVEDAPLAELIRTRILEPNGLTSTYFEGGEPLRAHALAPGYSASGADVSADYSLSWAWAAGAMAATPEDTARFIELLATGALLPPELQAELTTGVRTSQPGIRYGLGVFLLDASLTAGAGPAIGHGGDIMGFHSAAWYLPESRVTVFGAVNSDRGHGNDVIVAAFNALYGPDRRSELEGEGRARNEAPR